jgi:hypothetical protein
MRGEDRRPVRVLTLSIARLPVGGICIPRVADCALLESGDAFKMWAVVVDVDISDVAAAVQGVNERVIPFVRDAPGFVAGYWIKLDDTHGTSVAVFETESQAQATVPSEDAPSPGVNLTSIKVGEVIGHT